MLKIDFNKQFELLPWEEQGEKKPENLNRILAFVLAKSNDTRSPVKLWNWAVQLSKDGILEIDKADSELLKDVILKNEMIFAAAKGQLLEIIDAAKEKGEKK